MLTSIRHFSFHEVSMHATHLAVVGASLVCQRRGKVVPSKEEKKKLFSFHLKQLLNSFHNCRSSVVACWLCCEQLSVSLCVSRIQLYLNFSLLVFYRLTYPTSTCLHGSVAQDFLNWENFFFIKVIKDTPAGITNRKPRKRQRMR